MSYGLQVFDGSGTVIFDNRYAQAGVVLDLFAPNNAGETRTYPGAAGLSVFTMLASGYSDVTATVDYALGYPRVVAQPGYNGASLVVFAS
jgi:hypothetical protein